MIITMALMMDLIPGTDLIRGMDLTIMDPIPGMDLTTTVNTDTMMDPHLRRVRTALTPGMDPTTMMDPLIHLIIRGMVLMDMMDLPIRPVRRMVPTTTAITPTHLLIRTVLTRGTDLTTTGTIPITTLRPIPSRPTHPIPCHPIRKTFPKLVTLRYLRKPTMRVFP
jgi:hypothetical protein